MQPSKNSMNATLENKARQVNRPNENPAVLTILEKGKGTVK